VDAVFYQKFNVGHKTIDIEVHRMISLKRGDDCRKNSLEHTRGLF